MRNFYPFSAAVLAATIFMFPVGAIAHDFVAGSLEIKHPWSAKAPPVAPVLGGYLTIVNTGSQPDRLLGATSPIADRMELHESSMSDGVARMRPIQGGIDIAPGQTLKLQPGGMHLMLVNPKQRPAEGEGFKATLQFEKAGLVEVEFLVQSKSQEHLP